MCGSSFAESVSLLLDTHKEFFIVALAGRGVSKDGGETRLDNLLEPFKDTLFDRVVGTEESVDRLVNAFTRLEYIVSLPSHLLDQTNGCTYRFLCVHLVVALESKCPLPWYTRLHCGIVVQKHRLELPLEGV